MLEPDFGQPAWSTKCVSAKKQLGNKCVVGCNPVLWQETLQEPLALLHDQ